MTIESLKDLQKVIALCRKTGIVTIKIDGIELQLGAEPYKAKPAKTYVETTIEEKMQIPAFTPVIKPIPEHIETDELTDEQLLFYSSVAEPGSQEQHQQQ